MGHLTGESLGWETKQSVMNSDEEGHPGSRRLYSAMAAV